MINLLIYISIILFCIVLVRLANVVGVAQQLKGESNDFPTEKDNKLQGLLFTLFIIAFGLFVLWSCLRWGPKCLPESASVHGVELDWLMNVNMIIIFIPFIITHIFMAYFTWKYAGTNTTKATYFSHSNKLELIWTIIPAIVLTFVITFGLKTWNEITREAPKDAMVVELYAKQFDWTARYSGVDNKLGLSNYRLIEGVNDLGVDVNDAASADDFTVKGEFHIPLGKSVVFKFRSRDVLHSAFMPHFRAQMNCVPGMITQLHFVPRITTKQMRDKLKNEKFDFVLLCNKICGAAHSNMQMNIIVDSPEEYSAWVKEQKTLAVTLASAPADSTASNVVKPDSEEVKVDSTKAVAIAEKK